MRETLSTPSSDAGRPTMWVRELKFPCPYQAKRLSQSHPVRVRELKFHAVSFRVIVTLPYFVVIDSVVFFGLSVDMDNPLSAKKKLAPMMVSAFARNTAPPKTQHEHAALCTRQEWQDYGDAGVPAAADVGHVSHYYLVAFILSK